MDIKKSIKFFSFSFVVIIFLFYFWLCFTWVLESFEFFKLELSITNDWWKKLVAEKDNKFELYMIATNTFVWMPAQLLTAVGVIVFAGWNIFLLKKDSEKKDLAEAKRDFYNSLDRLENLFSSNPNVRYDGNVSEAIKICVYSNYRKYLNQHRKNLFDLEGFDFKSHPIDSELECFHLIHSVKSLDCVKKRARSNSLLSIKIEEMLDYSDVLGKDFVYSNIYNTISYKSDVGLKDESFLFVEYFSAYCLFEQRKPKLLLDFFVYACERYNESNHNSSSDFLVVNIFRNLLNIPSLNLKLSSVRFMDLKFNSDDSVTIIFYGELFKCGINFPDNKREGFKNLDVNTKKFRILNKFISGGYYNGVIYF